MPRCHTCITRHPRVQRGVSPRVHQQTPPMFVSLLSVTSPVVAASSSLNDIHHHRYSSGGTQKLQWLFHWEQRASGLEKEGIHFFNRGTRLMNQINGREAFTMLSVSLTPPFPSLPSYVILSHFPGKIWDFMLWKMGVEKTGQVFFFLTFSPHMDIVLQSLFRFGFGFGLNLYYTMGIPSHQITVRFKLITIPQFFIVKPAYFSTRIIVFPTLFDEVGRPLKPQCVWI